MTNGDTLTAAGLLAGEVKLNDMPLRLGDDDAPPAMRAEGKRRAG